MTDLTWFAPANAELPRLFQEQYIDSLADTPHKVDILLKADEMTGAVQAELLARLAHHHKVGTLIFYKADRTQRPLILAQAAALGLQHIRFCDSEDELRVLLNKRRSRTLAGSLLPIQ